MIINAIAVNHLNLNIIYTKHIYLSIQLKNNPPNKFIYFNRFTAEYFLLLSLNDHISHII